MIGISGRLSNLNQQRVARSAGRIEWKARPRFAAIAFHLQPAQSATETLANCRRRMRGPVVTFMRRTTPRPRRGRRPGLPSGQPPGHLEARISAPIILPPQMTCRDLVLMASDYSATEPDAQSTTLRDHIGSVTLPLGQASAAAPRKSCKKGWNCGDGGSVKSRQTYYHR